MSDGVPADAWGELARPSKAQRRTLYRLGFSRHFVSCLATGDAADAAIRAGIALQGELRAAEAWKKSCVPKEGPDGVVPK